MINKGIGGNRLLSDPTYWFFCNYGEKAIDRYVHDVLDVAGATDVIIALGTNDIGMQRKNELIQVDDLITSLESMAHDMKKKGLNIYCATVTPRGAEPHFTDIFEAQRKQLNRLIRKSDAFDKIIDFESCVQDRENPAVLAADCDSGDHLHPGAVGGYRGFQVYTIDSKSPPRCSRRL